ncbi:MAG TPA: hypothetical protein VIM61_15390 [Chthoniobacterales bacterium]|jgi:hypothetical protein
MHNTTDLLIANRFEAGQTDIDGLIAPLADLAQDSASLIVGYAPTASRQRQDAIPYFHVCGSYAEHPPVRALIVGGWFGNEVRSPYAIARLIATMEKRASLAAGLEVTAFPVANLEAHRAKTYLTDDQFAAGASCWEESPSPHVQVIEKELLRYPYDIVIFLRENPRAVETDAEAWLVEESHKRVLSEALEKYAADTPHFRWKTNPSAPVYRRSFTPVPGVNRQPSEVIIGLSAARTPAEQTNDVAGIVFALLHSVRQARQEGRL